jgi:mannose-1-phosphate guanylyltransferase
VYAVILAGGGGTRLWPLSRAETPKPFLPLLGDRSLLQLTVDRIVGHPELPITADDVTVVTDRRYAGLVREQLADVHVIVEPAGRNTAAAVALATLRIERPDDDVMVVLPADHLIRDEAAHRRSIAAAASLAGGAFGIDEPLVTIGVRPDRPATEYGYLVPDSATRETLNGVHVAALQAFEEKPTRERATELLGDPATAWNAGVFVWQRATIRHALERYTGLVTLLDSVTKSESGLLAAYDQLLPLSVDRAVLEGAAADRRVAMASFDGGWSDLGGWSSLLDAIGGSGDGRVAAPGEAVTVAADDLLIERIDGRLSVAPGPREVRGTAPVAVLRDAVASRGVVETLLDRVTSWEERRAVGAAREMAR